MVLPGMRRRPMRIASTGESVLPAGRTAAPNRRFFQVRLRGIPNPGDPGCNKYGSATPKYDHFGPRVGFAWSPSSGPAILLGSSGTHNLAVRGGFGIYYNRDQEEGQLQNLSSPPFVKIFVWRGRPCSQPGFRQSLCRCRGTRSRGQSLPLFHTEARGTDQLG